MAQMNMLLASTLVLAGRVLSQPVLSEEQAKGSMIRRHQESSTDSAIGLGAHGEMSLMHMNRSTPKDREISDCNRDYNVGTTNSDTCTKGEHIYSSDLCIKAATKLRKEVAPIAEWIINIDHVNPSNHPKGCLLFQDKVYYNPTQPNPEAYEGSPICWREKYPRATPAAGNTAGTCTSDFAVITDVRECNEAWQCIAGTDSCRKQDFRNGALPANMVGDPAHKCANCEVADKPRGCYIGTDDGCYGFNYGIHGTDTSATSVAATSICMIA